MENVGNLQSYRKGVKLLDATLRDGGIVNSFYFKDDFVKALYEANLAAGVDIMEFGYKVSKKMFDTSKFTVTVVNTGDSQKNVNATVDADGHLTGYKPSVDIEGAEAVKDGVFEESTLRSAPYFDVQIDGITLLNAKF